ncbi:MAG: hypothetical protein QXU18_14675 [Thermoplasmatales archaeon]
MISGRTPPVLSMLSSAEDIFKMRSKYRFVLLWTIIASIWIIISSILVASYAILGKQYEPLALDAFVVLIIFVGIPLLATSFFAINDSKKGTTKLEKFIQEFYPIWVKARFELSISFEGTLQDKITSILADLDEDFRRYEVNPQIRKDTLEIRRNFDFIIKGKGRVATVKIMDKNSIKGSVDIGQLESASKNIANMIRVKRALLIVIITGNNKSQLNEMSINAENVKGVRSIVVSYNGFNFYVEKVTPLGGKSLTNQ